jgi:hypothetical protein
MKRQPHGSRFCAEKASDFNKSQHLSTSGLQQVQYQSVRNNKFQQISIGYGIWFGTRGLPATPPGTPLDSTAENGRMLLFIEMRGFQQAQIRLQLPSGGSNFIQYKEFRRLIHS